MGCCVFINTKRQILKENFEIIVTKENNNKYVKSISDKNNLYINNINKEEIQASTSTFPSKLIKSKDNPKGIVILKMKNSMI